MPNYNMEAAKLIDKMSEKSSAELRRILDCDSSDSGEKIITRLRYYGSNDIASFCRSISNFFSGAKEVHVSYDEIVLDVYQRLQSPWFIPDIFAGGRNSTVYELESKIVNNIAVKIMDKLTPEKKAEFIVSMRSELKKANVKSTIADDFISFVEIKGFQEGLLAFAGYPVFSMILNNMILKYVFSLFTTMLVGNFLALLVNPVLLALLPIQIAGPAYRKTVSAIFLIGLFRTTQNKKRNMKYKPGSL